jgi:hypothetical protein
MDFHQIMIILLLPTHQLRQEEIYFWPLKSKNSQKTKNIQKSKNGQKSGIEKVGGAGNVQKSKNGQKRGIGKVGE